MSKLLDYILGEEEDENFNRTEIAAMMQRGILVPKIAARHEFSDSGVNEAFHQLLQRRSVGKHIMVLEDEDNQQQ